MNKSKFKIELRMIHWLENSGEQGENDLCAHGKVRVTIGDEIVVDNSEDKNDWWSLTAMALHLLRTLEINHTSEFPVGDCLVPSEGHHIDHHQHDKIVHVETAYPMAKGRNWWVFHLDSMIKLVTETSIETVISFDDYKNEVLYFVDKVQDFYKTSKPKLLPKDDYDKEGYLKLWHEWKIMREKWK